MPDGLVEEYVRRVERNPSTGRIVRETHLLNGVLHREGAPAELQFSDDGRLVSERWWNHGRHLRVDGPSTTQWDAASGVVTFQVWATEHGLHREAAPAKISRDAGTGVVEREEFYLFGKKHNETGPSLVVRDPASGIVVLEEWKQQDQLTRLGGKAALIERDPVSGEVTYEEFWLDGIPLDETPAETPQQAPGPLATEWKSMSGQLPRPGGPKPSP